MSSAYSFIPLLSLPDEVGGEPAQTTEIEPHLARFRASLGPLGARLSSASELIRALETRRRTDPLVTTISPLDQLLAGGLSRGRLTELAGYRSTGRFSVSMATLASATAIGEAAALIDLGDHFDPQLAEDAGVDLHRLLWIRPRTLKDAVFSSEAVIHTGFQLVILDLGMHPLPGPRVPEAAWVRLARAAEASGSALLVSSPYPVSRIASEATIAARKGRARWQGGGKAPRLLTGLSSILTLEKHRHQRPGDSAEATFRMQCSVMERALRPGLDARKNRLRGERPRDRSSSPLRTSTNVHGAVLPGQ